MKLKSIEQEAADCRKAFEGIEVGALVLHCHHCILAEQLIAPAENRIACILESKSVEEQALRLRLFRPISKTLLKSNAKYREAYEDWEKAYANRRKANDDWLKADADWEKAKADWRKAYADWEKANDDWREANDDWRMANDDWLKAQADWLKAYANRQKADADWRKAYADWEKAKADWEKAKANLEELIHEDVCKGCPWDGKTIFHADSPKV